MPFQRAREITVARDFYIQRHCLSSMVGGIETCIGKQKQGFYNQQIFTKENSKDCFKQQRNVGRDPYAKKNRLVCKQI